MHALTHLLLLLLFLTRSRSDPRATEPRLVCGSTQLEPSPLIPLFTQAMNSLSETFTTQNFAMHYFNNTSTPMYTLGQCHADLSRTDCRLCYSSGCTKLARCLPSSSGRIFLDGCFLRYDNYSFFNEHVDHERDAVSCSAGNAGNSAMQDNGTEFTSKVGGVLEDVTRIASDKDGFFGVSEKDGIYGLAQCWESLSVEGCKACLEKAGEGLRGCGGKKEGRAMNAGCFVRYSTTKFYGDGDQEDDDGPSTAGILWAVILSALALLVIVVSAAYGVYAKLSKEKIERKNLGKIFIWFNKSGLNYKYETLEKATNYFCPSMKLGEGANGSVYKGRLPSGEVVAVKRLIFNTKQWVDKFFNEVNLISGIQHKNLVKLLGCSIEGPESLLVYEYVPNNSLDPYIFDQNKARILTWKERFNIIAGIAEGLAHLHEGSQVRIIHRDIKSSNVLLDENLSPKIADFGLAHSLATDESHRSTEIAGTLGYTAPEYLIKGQLNEKADVYSFGVLVLEIVCGRRNTSVQDSGPLLQTVWTLYKSDKLPEAVDPSLINDFPSEEASYVLRIGLLCTQASAALRPSMVEVVKMLGNEGSDISIPTQPPFLNPSVVASGSSTVSCSTGNLVSPPGTIHAVFDTSSES